MLLRHAPKLLVPDAPHGMLCVLAGCALRQGCVSSCSGQQGCKLVLSSWQAHTLLWVLCLSCCLNCSLHLLQYTAEVPQHGVVTQLLLLCLLQCLLLLLHGTQQA